MKHPTTCEYVSCMRVNKAAWVENDIVAFWTFAAFDNQRNFAFRTFREQQEILLSLAR